MNPVHPQREDRSVRHLDGHLILIQFVGDPGCHQALLFWSAL
jgi:hypothetical protein